jgi:hypothetical protein
VTSTSKASASPPASRIAAAVSCAGVAVDAMLFGRAEPVPARIRSVYTPAVDRYASEEALTIIIDHWQPSLG